MKKILTCLLSLSMVFAFSATAFAADSTNNAESELNSISDNIVITVNELYGNNSSTITADDINYNKAVKVYVDTNVFELSTNKASEIETTLENGNYIYLLPIEVNNGTVVVNIQKGLPLSDNAITVLTQKEQQEILDNVGKWVVSSTAFYDSGNKNYDYLNTLSNVIGEIPEGTILVGSLPVFHDVVALVPNDEGTIESLIPVTNTVYDESSVKHVRNSDNVYNYEQIKEYANKLPAEDSNMAGNAGMIPTTNYQIIIISVFALLSVGGILFTFTVKNKKSDN